jgi:hypothetical protein
VRQKVVEQTRGRFARRPAPNGVDSRLCPRLRTGSASFS